MRISLIEARTSLRSASRTISSTWVWNSAAMRRAFLIQPVTARIATGMSFGPIAIIATTAIRAISDQAKSNMMTVSSAQWSVASGSGGGGAS